MEIKSPTENTGRICIIRSNSVNPDSRVEKIVYSLKKNGYDVSVFAWDRDSNHGIQRESINVLDKRITVYRVGYKASFGEGIKNLFPYLKFQLSIIKWIRNNDYSVIHACDFDTALSTYLATRRKKAKFIFDIFDFLFSEPKGFFQRIIQSVQYYLIRQADATIICTEKRKQQIKGSHPRRLCVIHNTPIEEMKDEFHGKSLCNTENRISIVYVGILQDYRLLVEIGQFFSEHKEYVFNIGGFGKYEEYYKKLAAENENIRFFGKIPYQETLRLESESDIMLAIYDPSIHNHKYAAPNKFYEALMLGKPLVMVKGTGMADVVEKNDIGVVVDYNISSFSSGIKELVKRNDEWDSISLRMKDLYKKNYSWDKMSRRLIGLYKKMGIIGISNE